MKLTDPKTGDSVICEPGSEGEAIWRAKGYLPKGEKAHKAADEHAGDDAGDSHDDHQGEAKADPVPIRRVQKPKA